jgi:hypothetical protein
VVGEAEGSGAVVVVVEAWRQREGVKKEDGVEFGVLC